MSDGRQASILIVDDNSLNRKKLKLAVKTLGYSAELAENGAQALDMLKGGQYDAMLLDLLMPEMDGFEVLITVDADDVLRDIPVIVISDLEGDAESVSRALSAGAEDFLPKGFDPVILNARLTACLRKKHFRDQELAYFKRVNALTDAAAQIEAGRFDETSLAGLEQESQRKDPIGNLASVFKGMAKEIHAREVRLLERIRLLQGSVLLVVVAAFSGLTPSLSRMASGYGSTPFWPGGVG
ncbi:MAG: response regulator [Pseudomonadota bacterium]